MAECSVLDLFLSLTSAGCKIRNWMFHLQVDMLQNILQERLSILPLVSTTARAAAEYNPSSRFTTAAPPPRTESRSHHVHPPAGRSLPKRDEAAANPCSMVVRV